MAYTKNDWTPVSGVAVKATPTKFNHFEQGIYDNSIQADKVPQLRTDTDSLILAEKVENGQRASLSVLGYSCPKLSDTVYDYVENNVLHKKVGRVDLGSLSWKYSTNDVVFYANLSDVKSNGLCVTSKYPYGGNTWSSVADNKCGVTSSKVVIIGDTTYTKATDFAKAMQGTYLYFELATEQTYSVLDNNALDSVGTCTNLAKPTMTTQVVGRLTVVKNSDGSYTINGTPDSTTYLAINDGHQKVPKGTKLRLVGCPSGGEGKYELFIRDSNVSSVSALDNGNGATFTYNGNEQDNMYMFITIYGGTVCSNLTFKPMLTTNLSAQYSDYVPFTGTSGKLNGDVAEIKADMLGRGLDNTLFERPFKYYFGSFGLRNLETAKTMFGDLPAGITWIYDTSGDEGIFIFVKSSLILGTITFWSYNDTHSYRLRCINGNWQSSSWEQV